MLKKMWNSGEIVPEMQFLFLFTIFCYLMYDFYVEIRIRFSLRDKRLFEVIEVEITRVDCILITCFTEKGEGVTCVKSIKSARSATNKIHVIITLLKIFKGANDIFP